MSRCAWVVSQVTALYFLGWVGLQVTPGGFMWPTQRRFFGRKRVVSRVASDPRAPTMCASARNVNITPPNRLTPHPLHHHLRSIDLSATTSQRAKKDVLLVVPNDDVGKNNRIGQEKMEQDKKEKKRQEKKRRE